MESEGVVPRLQRRRLVEGVQPRELDQPVGVAEVGRPEPRLVEHPLGGAAPRGDGLQDTRRGPCSDGPYRGSASPVDADYLAGGAERQAARTVPMR